jgi:hypothetical protein
MTRVRERRGNAGSCFLFSFEEVLLREAPNYPLSFRGATTVASPESIVSHECWEKWIPGSLVLLAPRNDDADDRVTRGHAPRMRGLQYSSGISVNVTVSGILGRPIKSGNDIE